MSISEERVFVTANCAQKSATNGGDATGTFQ